MIRKDPQNLDGGATYFDTHRHILWERLFNYVRDSETLRFPYEPIDVTKSEPHERDASKNAYNVELYSVLDLTDLTLDDSAPEYDADLIDPTNYSAIKHKVFFKLWVTRDEGRDQYGTASEPGTVVTTFLSNDGKPFPEIRDWIGTPLKDLTSNGKPLDITTEELAVDLHPIWSMKRDDGFVPNIHPDCGVVLPTPEICVYIAETSLFRPNYLTDFLNWDGYERDDDKPDRLGVLSFPVPYLAIQRGDYDIWFGKYRTEKDILNKNGEVVHVKDTEVSIRGSEKATSTIPTEHPSYTKFTLWSLGTVREVNHELLQKSEDSRFSPYPLIAESKQKISDFKIVARTLYRMDFYMDVRAADITDEEAYRLDTDIDQQEVDICVTPDDKKHRNLNNQAYYNALKVSVCDLSADESVKTVFEPMGIISESQQKWPYRDSKKE